MINLESDPTHLKGPYALSVSETPQMSMDEIRQIQDPQPFVPTRLNNMYGVPRETSSEIVSETNYGWEQNKMVQEISFEQANQEESMDNFNMCRMLNQGGAIRDPQSPIADLGRFDNDKWADEPSGSELHK